MSLLVGLVLLFVWVLTASLWSDVFCHDTISGYSEVEGSGDEEQALYVFQWTRCLKKWGLICTMKMKVRLCRMVPLREWGIDAGLQG